MLRGTLGLRGSTPVLTWVIQADLQLIFFFFFVIKWLRFCSFKSGPYSGFWWDHFSLRGYVDVTLYFKYIRKRVVLRIVNIYFLNFFLTFSIRVLNVRFKKIINLF